MYQYDSFDSSFVNERVNEFRDQVRRRLNGELDEDQFRPLRLMNGLYLQLHAYMLRISIPYGLLSSKQLRNFAFIAEKYDRGYGHFTTRQNLQFNWIKLQDTPDILAKLAEVNMHAMQTSGNCVRNITADPLAGIAVDEYADPRPYAEIIRQWSTLNPEFSYLPRKFKIALSGAKHDRAAVKMHDIGLYLLRQGNELGFKVYAGGGLGRTPFLGHMLREFLPAKYILSYIEAILRVYNLEGRRDNKHKARIKILFHELGPDEVTRRVENEYLALEPQPLSEEELTRVAQYFGEPPYEQLPENSLVFQRFQDENKLFAQFVRHNVFAHRIPGYAAVNISLKSIGKPPGDITAQGMRLVADLAEKYSFDEIRATHDQNLILPSVKKDDIYEVYKQLLKGGLAEANIGLISDIIACPGLDYCALATARSIPIATQIAQRFADQGLQNDIGEMKIKISGCINACGHHHIGNIGILGLERNGEEFYQISIGGSADEQAALGEIVGKGFSSEEIVDAIDNLVRVYLSLRLGPDEPFINAYRRVGQEPFRNALYQEA